MVDVSWTVTRPYLSQAGADPEIIFFSKGPEVQIKLI